MKITNNRKVRTAQHKIRTIKFKPIARCVSRFKGLWLEFNLCFYFSLYRNSSSIQSIFIPLFITNQFFIYCCCSFFLYFSLSLARFASLLLNITSHFPSNQKGPNQNWIFQSNSNSIFVIQLWFFFLLFFFFTSTQRINHLFCIVRLSFFLCNKKKKQKSSSSSSKCVVRAWMFSNVHNSLLRSRFTFHCNGNKYTGFRSSNHSKTIDSVFSCAKRQFIKVNKFRTRI